MKKLYITTWVSAQDLGGAISYIKRQGWSPRTLSGAVSAIIKEMAREEGLSEEDAVSVVEEIKKSATTYELKRGEMPCTPMKSDSTS
jgi:hypothetical protein